MSESNYTCGECKNFSEARGICLKTGDKRAKINLYCKYFRLSDEVAQNILGLPGSEFIAPTPSEEKKDVKVCKCCGRELPIEKFGTCPRNPQKRFDICNDCKGKKARDAKLRMESERIQQKVQAAIDNMPSVKEAKAEAEKLVDLSSVPTVEIMKELAFHRGGVGQITITEEPVFENGMKVTKTITFEL